MKPKKKDKVKNYLDEENVLDLYEEHQKISNNLIKDSTLFFKREFDIFVMSTKILNHTNDIWCPTIDNVLVYNYLKLNTWFDIKETIPENVNFVENNYTVEEKEEAKYKCKKVEIDFTEKQKQIMNIQIYAFSDMYNVALKYIKENINDDKNVLKFFYLRNILKKEKEILVKRSGIKVHDIDYAIKLACQNYKSALTNFKKGHIKHFRVRYWRKNKSTKIMDMEKNDFNGNSIRKNILGEVKGYYNGKRFNFDLIECDCRLQKCEGKYYLFVPELILTTETDNKSKQITIDPGIRRFGTGITENKVVKIGEGSSNVIKKYILRKDKIMSNENISKKIQKKNEKMINNKISNLVKELHWKTINYLVKNYETVLIGNMSSKSIVSKKGNLNKMTKRIAMHLSFDKFHKRLKYKCNVNGVKYGKINEWMTSKMCSVCGNIHENLGSSEIYECIKCNTRMERDVQGARCINIKGIKD